MIYRDIITMFAHSLCHSEQMKLQWVNQINDAKNLCDAGATTNRIYWEIP